MRLPIALAIVTLGLGLAGCTPAVDTAEEEAAIRANTARWLELDHAADVDGIVGLFAEDGTVHWEDRGVATGSEAIRTFMSDVYAENPNPEGSFAPERVRVAASGDLAVEEGTYENPFDRGRYITVHRKVGTEWKVQSDISVSSAPNGGAPDWAAQMLAQWYEQYNARNAQGLANLYSANAVVGDARGRAAIIARFRAGWAEADQQCAGAYDDFVLVGTIAAGWGRDVCTTPSGDVERSQWLAVFEQQPNGTWLMIRDRGEPFGA